MFLENLTDLAKIKVSPCDTGMYHILFGTLDTGAWLKKNCIFLSLSCVEYRGYNISKMPAKILQAMKSIVHASTCKL